VKVAYVLVTTAFLMGAQPPGQKDGPKDGAKDSGAPKVVVQPAPVSGDCGCNSCNTCDTGSGGWCRFREFCSGLCRRHDSCGCDNGCGSNCGGGLCGGWHRPSCFGGGGGCGCAAQTNTCNTCNDNCGCGGGFAQRCRDFCGRLFHRNDCCDTCNNGCNGYGGAVRTEQIPPPKDGTPPKEMPKGPGGGEPPQKQVQNYNSGQPLPVPAPTFDAPPAAPAITPANPNQERPF
jgi:hypothetical protein